MPDVLSCPPRLRFVRRHAVQPVIDTRVRGVCASVLHPRFGGDYWIVERDEAAVVCIDGRDLAYIRALPLDVPALNHLLDRVHHRRPRR